MRKILFSVIIALLLAFVSSLLADNIWQDDFNAGQMKAVYKMSNGGNGKNPPKWVQEGGVMKQVEPKPGDPTYLLVEVSKDTSFCGQLVKIRFDSWEDHDRSRAGVGFWNDPNDKYNGYTTVIHNSLVTGNFQFLNDARAWDNDHKVNVNIGKVGVWFWMRSEIDSKTKTISTKIWLGDLKDEPKAWMIQADYSKYGAVRNVSKWVGLNGGAGTDGGASTVSFDDWYVYDSGGPITTAVDQIGKIASTWGDIKR